MLPQLSIKGEYFRFLLSRNMVVINREAVMDYEFLRGRQNETVVKELCVTSAATETFRFKPPYKLVDHGLTENGIN